FASGYEEIIPNVRTTFSCDGRIYGYYADVENDCKVFHVCSPSVDDNGKVLGMAHYSFFCGNLTMFNQESLTCTDPEDALPCNEAPNLYEIKNLEFGIIPQKKTGN
ncbi:U-scoloptoxin(01)-Cw1a-like, partial [Hetaerina americana]|uniref:U-scoloptoxin(01)-Cw1a-like n=1 Tax=Hetaerina americana TaxID=62018 RepID=UPI003A7F3D3C